MSILQNIVMDLNNVKTLIWARVNEVQHSHLGRMEVGEAIRRAHMHSAHHKEAGVGLKQQGRV